MPTDHRSIKDAGLVVVGIDPTAVLSCSWTPFSLPVPHSGDAQSYAGALALAKKCHDT
jgi:hypothetical protein